MGGQQYAGGYSRGQTQAQIDAHGATEVTARDAAIAAARALQQPDWVLAGVGLPPPTGNANTTVAGRLWMNHVRVGRAVPVTKMTYGLTTAAGNVDLGIYTANAGRTLFTLVASTGATVAALTATGYQTINLSASFTLQPGVDYWFALWTGSATLTIARGSGLPHHTVNHRGWVKDIGGTACPATLDGTVTSSSGSASLDLMAW